MKQDKSLDIAKRILINPPENRYTSTGRMSHDEMRFCRRELINRHLQNGTFKNVFAIREYARTCEWNEYGSALQAYK